MDKDDLYFAYSDGATLRNDHAVKNTVDEPDKSGHIGLLVDTNFLTLTLGTADSTMGKKDSKW